MQKQTKDFIKETVYIIVISLIIVLPIRAFIAQPYVVSGASMDNTFQNGNYLIIDEISYRFEEPKRGEVIVFKVPPKGLELQKVALTKTIYYIKRIIGLPGETVEINGDIIKIYNKENPKGKILTEPYIYINKLVPSPFSDIKLKTTLKDGEYFVMGDNRHNSSDSRLWGVLPRENIIGRTYLRLFPFNEIKTYPGTYLNY
ncbi:MAG: signal peptidase I [Candidatus Paceibacterota bacterium]|jgi:signal peptidase I